MSWDGYVDTLMTGGICQDAAIVGYSFLKEAPKAVWASHKGGCLKNITDEQIDVLVGDERQNFFINGLTLGPWKCSVLRDCINVTGDWTMDLRTKAKDGEPGCCITVAKSEMALVIVMGNKEAHGGNVNKKAHGMACYLRECGY